MRVAWSGRTASAIKRSYGSAWKPVRYAIDTGFVMYAASTLCAAIHARRSSSGVIAVTLINAGDAHAVRVVGRLDLDLFADLVPDQCLAQRGLVADPACFGIRFGGSDDSVGLLAGSVLAEAHGAAHIDDAGRLLGLDQDVVLDDRLELVDPRLHHSLLVFRGVVLEVLRRVAEFPGVFDLGHDVGPADFDELVKLLLHRHETFGGDVYVVDHLWTIRRKVPFRRSYTVPQ